MNEDEYFRWGEQGKLSKQMLFNKILWEIRGKAGGESVGGDWFPWSSVLKCQGENGWNCTPERNYTPWLLEPL